MTITTVLMSMAIVLTGAQLQAQAYSSRPPAQNVRPCHSPTLQKASAESRIVPAHPVGIQNEAFINPNPEVVFVPSVGSMTLGLIPIPGRISDDQENPYSEKLF